MPPRMSACLSRFPDTNAFNGLQLLMRYDDGFAAFLNGHLIASANAPGGIPTGADPHGFGHHGSSVRIIRCVPIAHFPDKRTSLTVLNYLHGQTRLIYGQRRAGPDIYGPPAAHPDTC